MQNTEEAQVSNKYALLKNMFYLQLLSPIFPNTCTFIETLYSYCLKQVLGLDTMGRTQTSNLNASLDVLCLNGFRKSH